MLITGVMPLPAVTKSGARAGLGKNELALRGARARGVAAPDLAHELPRHATACDRLHGDRDAAVVLEALRRGRDRVGADVPAAVDRDADADELPGAMARASRAPAGAQRAGVGRLFDHLLRPARASPLQRGPRRLR